MKNGAEYAKRIKRLFKQLQREDKADSTAPADPTDPTEQLIVSILSLNTTSEQGRRAYRRLCDRMVDFNELRVSSPAEITHTVRDLIPTSSDRAKALVNTLNAVFQQEHRVDLGRLQSMGIRDARRYLEKLHGIDPYTVASITLWSLGGHAIPVNNRLLDALRADELVAPECSVADVQSFLERHVSAKDARQFCRVMEKFAAARGRSGSTRTKRAKSSAGGARKSPKKKTKARKASKTGAVKRKKAKRRT
jgi:endonuclease III